MFLVGGTPLVDPRPRHNDREHKGEQDQHAEGRDELNCHGRLTHFDNRTAGDGLLQASLLGA
jgi:hypothetical protein